MNSSNWIRWGSLAAMLGGVVFATDTVLTLTVADPSKDRWLDIHFVVGILLVVVGLMGFQSYRGNATDASDEPASSRSSLLL